MSLDRYDSWALQVQRMVTESAASGHPIIIPDPGTGHGRALVLALGAQIDYALPIPEPDPEFAGRPESWYRAKVAEIRAGLRAQGVKDRTPGRERAV